MSTPGFTITVPRLKVQHIIDWFTPQLLSEAELFAGRLPPAQPNRAIGVVTQPGRGFEMENEVDNPVYMMMSRGASDNFSDAEDIAYELDSVIMNGPTNFDIAENVHVDMIVRQGGAPSAQPIVDSQSRWTFTCPYIFKVFTNID